jgi:hypothetical protein
MQRPDFDVPHRVVHARCAVCGGAIFQLFVDEAEYAKRLCFTDDCPDEDGHFICDCEDSFDDDTEQWCVCPCRNDTFEIAVGFSHTLVATHAGAERKSGKVRPEVDWVYVACRCVECGLVGLYTDWRERRSGSARLYGLV